MQCLKITNQIKVLKLFDPEVCVVVDPAQTLSFHGR